MEIYIKFNKKAKCFRKLAILVYYIKYIKYLKYIIKNIYKEYIRIFKIYYNKIL